MLVHLNGRLVPEQEARVALADAGFLHGVGLFETFFARGGRVARLSRHLARLRDSASQTGIAAHLQVEPLENAVHDLLAANKLADARIRLTLTPGTLSMLRRGDAGAAAAAEPTLAIVPQEPTPLDPAWFETGVTVRIHGQLANPFDPLAGHKTLNYWGRLAALRQAGAAGAAEAVLLSVTGHLASGCVSNLLLVKDGRLLTPFARGEELPKALPAPVLPGITRAAVLEAAEAAGIPAEKRMLTVADLLDADEVFLTNSNWLVLPVVQVEQKAIGAGAPGPVTTRLRQALLTDQG